MFAELHIFKAYAGPRLQLLLRGLGYINAWNIIAHYLWWLLIIIETILGYCSSNFWSSSSWCHLLHLWLIDSPLLLIIITPPMMFNLLLLKQLTFYLILLQQLVLVLLAHHSCVNPMKKKIASKLLIKVKGTDAPAQKNWDSTCMAYVSLLTWNFILKHLVHWSMSQIYNEAFVIHIFIRYWNRKFIAFLWNFISMK